MVQDLKLSSVCQNPIARTSDSAVNLTVKILVQDVILRKTFVPKWIYLNPHAWSLLTAAFVVQKAAEMQDPAATFLTTSYMC